MKILFFLILLYFNNLGTILNANQFDFKIGKEEKELIEIFETVCKKLLNNLKIEKVKNWELQNITNNSIFITNPKTLQDLFIKIVKRGVNTKAYRFTFNNYKEDKKDGEQLEYYKNGNIKEKSNYKLGILDGLKIQYLYSSYQ